MPKTADELNNLTKNFYETCAQYWNNSENYEWRGWSHILKYFPTNSDFSVLDLGAGSGRFGHYLGREFGKRVDYTAVDYTDFYVELMQSQPIKVIRSQKILQKDLFQKPWGVGGQADFVCTFGLIHHLPTDMRDHFFGELLQVFTPDTIGLVTTWQYLDQPRLAKKVVEEKSHDMPGADNILDWTKGQYGERYSHHWSIEEVVEVGGQYGFAVEYLPEPSAAENGLNNYFLFRLQN